MGRASGARVRATRWLYRPYNFIVCLIEIDVRGFGRYVFRPAGVPIGRSGTAFCRTPSIREPAARCPSRRRPIKTRDSGDRSRYSQLRGRSPRSCMREVKIKALQPPHMRQCEGFIRADGGNWGRVHVRLLQCGEVDLKYPPSAFSDSTLAACPRPSL